MSRVVSIPVSFGEFYDKITILEIKVARIAQKEKLELVLAELSLLQDVRSNLADEPPELPALIARLREVNERIWESEDLVRAFAQKRDFSAAYVSASQQSYTNNDQRARIKREINEIMQSGIVEVKEHNRTVI